jgi:putative ABC transport system substrate-binding protein
MLQWFKLAPSVPLDLRKTMRRRGFITGVGAAAALRFAAHAQPGARVRRIAIMPPGFRGDTEANARLEAFRKGLDQLGWRENRNIRFDYWWTDGKLETIKKAAGEMVTSAPDLILSGITPGVQALKIETSTIPILFANVADPVASGLVPNLAKPGGNVTGFTAVEYAIVGKWLGLLKEIAPETKRVALIGNPDVVFIKSFFQELQSIAPAFAMMPVAANVRTAANIEQAIEAFAREPNGGLLFVPEFTPTVHRAVIFRFAPATACLRFIRSESTPWTVGLRRTARIRSNSIAVRPDTPIAFCAGRSRPICRCKRRPSSTLSSTSRSPKRLG